MQGYSATSNEGIAVSAAPARVPDILVRERIFALLVTSLVLSGMDTLRVPRLFLEGNTELYPMLWGETLWLLLRLAWLPLLLCAIVIGLEQAGPRRNAVLIAQALAAGGISLALMMMNNFRTRVLLPLSALALILVAIASLARIRRPSWIPVLARGAAAAASVAALLLYHVNYQRYSSRYLTISASVLVIVCAILFHALPYVLRIRSPKINVGLGIGALVLLSLTPLTSLARDLSKIESGARALTSIGRAATRLDHQKLVEQQLPKRHVAPPLSDTERVEFQRLSGMPALSVLPERPNLLLVTMEATRFDRTSLADPTLETTPSLVELARSGAFVFTKAQSPGVLTLQAIASIHAMALPSSAGLNIWSAPWRGELRPETTTVAELLRGDGYETWMVSHSFRSVFQTYTLGLNQGFSDIRYVTKEEIRAKHGAAAKRVDEFIASEAIERLRRAARQRRPFFGWVFFESPHDSYQAHYPDMPGDTDEQRYRQELRYADAQLGRVLAELKTLGLLEETIVVFMADHGEELYEHGGIGHFTLHRECTHIPLLARVPGHVGSRIELPTSSAFALPWVLLHLEGGAKRAAEKRVSGYFLPLLRATEGAPATDLLGPEHASFSLIDRHGARTICHLSTDWCELYDAADVREADDLRVAGVERPTLERMATAYRRFRQEHANYRFVPDAGPEPESSP